MTHRVTFADNVECQIRRASPLLDQATLRGLFHLSLIRDGRTIHEAIVKNGITDAAKNDLLNTYFNGGTPITLWYLGLISGAGFTGVASTDTLASHSGWTELSSYTNGGNAFTRPQWSPGAPASKMISNSVAPLTLIFNAACVVEGVLIAGGAGNNTKGNTSGILWSTAIFGGTLTANINDQLNISYGVSL